MGKSRPLWRSNGKITTLFREHTPYTHEASYNAKFYVRDDDGNMATDVRIVTVQNSAPVITSIRPDTTISIKDSITLRVTAVDNDGTIKEYSWDVDGDGTFDYTSPSQPNTGCRYNIAGIYKAIFKVTDDDNKVTKDTALVTVLQDVPVVNAGKDTVVSINDLIRLHGSVTDGFGVIVKWEWDLGNTGNFIQTLASDTCITASSSENLNYQCVLRATDDDGNVAKDTVKISVLQDVPIAEAGRDTTVIINSPVTLKGTYTQQFGTIVMYKWDFNGDGMYDDSSATTSAMRHTYTHAAAYITKFYVRDDDDNVATDIRVVTVYNSAPVITSIRPDTTITTNDSITLWATAVDNDGTIKEYAWDGNGDGTFDYTSPSQPNTGYRYNIAGIYRAIIRVTDDDGKAIKDTVIITVYGLITDIDGNVYHTLKIGNQEWTVENLRVTKYNDNTAIPLVTVNSAWAALRTPGYCYYYNNTGPDFQKKWGALYNWYAVDTKKLAPAGWHVPTDAEWTILENYLIANGYNWDGTITDNKIAKAMAAKTDWSASTNAGAIGNDVYKNNRSGFSALPGGYRRYNGDFIDQSLGIWWSATEEDASDAWTRTLDRHYDHLSGDGYIRRCGFSVRLVRD